MKQPIRPPDEDVNEFQEHTYNNEHVYNMAVKTEFSSSVKLLFELTSRIDERVKILTESNAKLEKRFETFMDMQNLSLQRITALESKNGTEIKRNVEDLNNRMREVEQKLITTDIIARGHQNRWEKIFEQGTKLLIAITAAFIIWKSGWSSSHILTPNLNVTPAPITTTAP
jgi:predicted nuclease with TOPRIM domain